MSGAAVVWHDIRARPEGTTLASGRRKRWMHSRMAANSSRGIATAAIWKITQRACVTTLAPILTNFSRNVVSVQCFARGGSTTPRVAAVAVLLGPSEVRR